MAVFTASDVVHPVDEAARRNLEAMHGLESAVTSYHKVYSERLVRSAQLAGNLRLGPKQLPEIYRLLPPICEAFGLAEPELFLAMGPVNAFTIGHSRTSITLFSELLEYLTLDEIEAVLAHECGHILCQHMLYHSMGEIVRIAIRLGGVAAVPFGSTLVQLVSGPLRVALAIWMRKSELSADRAAAAYLGSPDAITRVMFRFAGVRKDSQYVYDVDLFGAQALEFEALRESRWDRLLQWQVGQASTHPLLAIRVREIQNWAGSPAFARLASLAEGIRTAPRCAACGRRVEPQWRHCQACGGKCEAVPAASTTRTE